MKGLMASLLAFAIFTQVVLANEPSSFGVHNGISSIPQATNTIHPPLEIDWEVFAKPPKYIMCAKDRLITVASDEIGIYAISTASIIKTIPFKHKTKPFVTSNLLIIANDDEIYAYDIDIGDLSWKHNMESVNFITSYRNLVVTVSGKTVNVLSEEGLLIKSFELSGEVESSPETDTKAIAFPCKDSKIRIFFDEGFSHPVEFTKPGTAINCTLLTDTLLYVVLSKGSGITFDINTGDSQWKTTEPTGSNIITVSDGIHLITYGTSSGIVCRRIVDGSFVWRYAKVEVSSMACSGRLLYVMTTGGNLIPIQISNGSDSGSVNLNGRPSGSLTVFNGKLFACIDAKIARLATSAFRAFLGFDGHFDLGVIYTNQITRKTITVSNLIGNRQEVKLFAVQTPFLSLSPSSFVVEPGQTMQVEITINATRILYEDFKGYIVADSPYYRYFLGVSALIMQLPGDCNLDCVVDGEDLVILAKSFGSRTYNSQYVKEADLDRNGVIDFNDMTIVSRNLGRVCTK
jgi:outer membrane protein assembly factor BamB